MAPEHAGTRGIKLAILSYGFLVMVQLAAYMATNITVLLAQSLEMLSDIFVSGFLLLSASVSRRPPDERHAFGYGRVENVAGLVSAVFLVSFMSIETLRESVPRLLEPQVTAMDIGLGASIVVLGMAVMAIPSFELLRSRAGTGSLRTQLVSLLKDEAASVVSLVGLWLVSTGRGWGDPLASTIIGAIIALSGLYLFRENAAMLVGKSPDKKFYDDLETTALSVEGVLGVHDLLAEYIGPSQIHAGLHIVVARGTPIEDADLIAESVKQRINDRVGCSQCVVHVDPEEK